MFFTLQFKFILNISLLRFVSISRMKGRRLNTNEVY